MARRYLRLKDCALSYEEWPKTVVTKQTFSDSFFLIRGTDNERPIWHYIMVSASNMTALKACKEGSNIDVTDYGRIVQYINNKGEIKDMSGWGSDPPQLIQNWMDKHYNSSSINENISLAYEKDDIRLCTMQRAIPKQRIGVYFKYFKSERFHFIILDQDLPFSLASRAGIQNYDRVICFNGTNVENDTVDQFMHRFEIQRHLPVQMLVCSPSTYAHYKANNQVIRCDLPTVQRLKPVYATSTSHSNTDTPQVYFDNEKFYAVQWEDSNTMSTVPQSAVFKAPEFTNIHDICFIEAEGQYKKGSQNDCDKLNQSLVPLESHNISTTLARFSCNDKTKHAVNSTETTAQDMMDDIELKRNTCTVLEDLPNELLYYIFNLIDIQHLYRAFWGLNLRLNNIFQSCESRSLIFDEKVDPLLMQSYAPHVDRLIVQTPFDCYLDRFPNLHQLILCIRKSELILQIQPYNIPELTHLCFLLGSNYSPPSSLIEAIFSNEFPFLSHVTLCHIYRSDIKLWTTLPSLKFISIHTDSLKVIQTILASCPNLDHFQVHYLNSNTEPWSTFQAMNHQLRQLTLWTDDKKLASDDVDQLLSCTPKIQHFYFQTIWPGSVIDLLNGLVKDLKYLSRFSCHIRERLNKHDRTSNISDVHQIHSCFHRIKCIQEQDKFRIFATD